MIDSPARSEEILEFDPLLMDILLDHYKNPRNYGELQDADIKHGEGNPSCGDQIEILAWRPSSRIPPLPGLQGHNSIPGKGDTVTVYLRAKNGGSYEPLLPNGIQIDKAAE